MESNRLVSDPVLVGASPITSDTDPISSVAWPTEAWTCSARRLTVEAWFQPDCPLLVGAVWLVPRVMVSSFPTLMLRELGIESR